MGSKKAPLGIAMAFMLALAVACGSGDDGGGGADTIKKLDDGFPKQPITILVADEPGSDDSIFAHQMQEVADKYSPVDVRVLDRPDFGTYGAWEAVVWQSTQPGGDDGNVVQVVDAPGSGFDLLVTPVAQDLGVSFKSLNLVGLAETAPYLVISKPDAPWGDSLEEMFQWGRDNPGELRYISRGPGGSATLGMAQYMQKEGVTAKTTVGGPHPEQNTSIAAGEADIAVTLAGQIAPFIDKVVVLGCTGMTNPCEGPWGSVPSVASVIGLDDDPFAAGRSLAVPEAVSDEHRDWLADLFAAITSDPEFVEARSSIPGMTPAFVGHDEVEARQLAGLRIARDLMESTGEMDPSVDPDQILADAE
jgi:tripartite-type tricarboxylate transporter receptor subunit TctC